MGLASNVYIRSVNCKTGQIREINGKNLITKEMIRGIIYLIHGEYIANNVDSVSRNTLSVYYPKFVGLGSGTSAVAWTDTDLEIPLTKVNNDLARYGATFDDDEIAIDDVNANMIMKFRYYIPSEDLIGETISEVALFPTSSGNVPCLARFQLDNDAFVKGQDEFIDIIWSITVKSA